MSRRDLIRMTDDEVHEFLHLRQTMNIGSFGPDGNIHLVAMWYGFLGEHPAFETFAKSQKVQNLRRDPRITVLVESGDRYEELQGVEIVGHARIHEHEETLMAVARDVVDRYFGIDNAEDLDAVAAGLARKRVAIEVVPEKIVSWDHQKLAGRY